MKKTLEKLMTCILISIILLNFCIINFSNAEDEPGPLDDFLEEKQTSFVGVLTWPIRIVALLAGTAVNDLTEGVAYTEGIIDENGNVIDGPESVKGKDTVITPFDIFFNRIAILDANFFNTVREGSIVSNIRNAIAGWYYAMRNIAATILLCVFIYVGIRMAFSTIASDKAAYKKMLVDWVCSLALIFLLQYIIIFTFSVNEAFIKALANVDDGTSISQAMLAIEALAHKTSNDAIAATVVYCMLVAQTLALFISYFNRMLKIAFLIIISPLITLTYSIDKMGDGKAQALGTWLKEFIYTVLIQSFHCIIYMAFIGMALSIFSTVGGESNNLAGVILVMLCVKFTKDGEKILGKIFKFSDSTSDTSLAVGLAASAMALQKAPAIGKGAKALVNGAKALPGGAKKFLNNAKVDAKTAGNMFFGGMGLAAAREKAQADVLEATAAKDESGGLFHIGKFQAADEGAEGKEYENLDNAVAEKMEKDKMSEEDATKEVTKDMSKEKKERYMHHRAVAAETKANKALGMSERLAKAQARATVASRNRSAAVKARFPKITKAVGTVNAVRQFANSSDVIQKISGLTKAGVSAGLGLATGSMVYGATGNEFTSIASGAAMYRGSQEFMKNSAKTLTNQTAELLQASGDQSAADAAQHISNIRARSDVFEDGTKLKEEIDNAFKEISGALDKVLGDDAGAFKGTVQNIVDRSIKENPNITNAELYDKLKSHGTTSAAMAALEAHPEAGTDKLKSTLGRISNTKRDKVIYDTLKSGGDAGISTEQLISRSLSIFEANQATSAAQATSKPSVAENYINNPSTPVDQAAVSNMGEEELEANIRRFEREAANAYVGMSEYMDPDEVSRRVKRAQDMQAQADNMRIEQLQRDYEDLQKQIAEFNETYKSHEPGDADRIMSSLRADIVSQRNAIIRECEAIAARSDGVITVTGTGEGETITYSRAKGSTRAPIEGGKITKKGEIEQVKKES